VGEDRDGFREYASARRSDLRRTAYLLCGDWHLADDLVQEALAKLFVRWRRVRAKGDVDPYVRRMLVNGYLATHRRPWRREVATADPPDRPARHDADDGTRDQSRRHGPTRREHRRTAYGHRLAGRLARSTCHW
jgi:DNA-directed RNA polymerase specialized sigma24 family protein